MARLFSKKSAKKKPWVSPTQVESLMFSRTKSGEVVRIGGFHYGDVYIGRIRFRGPTGVENAKRTNPWKRVAIKTFKTPLDAKKAQRYQKVIADLRKAGVRLPKMGMVKMRTRKCPGGEWVQVSQLFGSTERGSKIVNKSNLNIKTKKGRREAIEEFIKVANAGYFPEVDLPEPFKNKRKGIIPLDLDRIVELSLARMITATPERRAAFLMEAIELLAKSTTNREYRQLHRTALEAASPEMRKALDERIVQEK